MEKTIGTALVQKTWSGDFPGDSSGSELWVECKCELCGGHVEFQVGVNGISIQDALAMGDQFKTTHKLAHKITEKYQKKE